MIEYRETGIWLSTTGREGSHIVDDGPFFYAHELLSEIVGPTTSSLVHINKSEVNFTTKGYHEVNFSKVVMR